MKIPLKKGTYLANYYGRGYHIIESASNRQEWERSLLFFWRKWHELTIPFL
jgi:hypothetical protein